MYSINFKNEILGIKTLTFRFTTSIENIGNDDFRPNVPKSHWVWHGCHQHYHSMEVIIQTTCCMFFSLYFEALFETII